MEPVQLKEQVNLREEDHPTKLYHLKVTLNVSEQKITTNDLTNLMLTIHR